VYSKKLKDPSAGEMTKYIVAYLYDGIFMLLLREQSRYTYTKVS
jgi:hypothetical protein